jgi:hypothetical protein
MYKTMILWKNNCTFVGSKERKKIFVEKFSEFVNTVPLDRDDKNN